ncbi:hypothetical protein CPB83DRAFT_857862 [Crepidotus variabilis]|uniref:Uncharacterized protein n=1 Tax=Crepidotus variabilis TaxID=179855 RepID=A0A9P6ECN5_9AGAR|nr:hypothetical protein CPB83DRAFT_857862 [Crepidotus variabilis]
MSQYPPEEQAQAGNSISLFAGAQNVNITGSQIHVHAPPPVQPSQAQPLPTTAPSVPTQPPHVVYQSQMLHKGRGFPLWYPSPNVNLPVKYRLRGISIGDVGYFTPEGGFEFLFNILLPANHSINGSASNVPKGFVPHSPLNPRDIREHWDFEAGAYICSPSVRASRVESSGLMFRSTNSEGAILTMPNGACKTELSSTTSFQRYATQHAESWYQFVHSRGRDVANGELRLVYGCDTSTTWSVAAFSNTANVELKFSKTQGGESSYSWEHSEMGETTRVGPGVHDNEGLGPQGESPRNQCLFLRAMTVTLSNQSWESLGFEIPAQSMFQDSSLSRSDQVSLWSMDPATIPDTGRVFRLLSNLHAVFQLHALDTPSLDISGVASVFKRASTQNQSRFSTCNISLRVCDGVPLLLACKLMNL